MDLLELTNLITIRQYVVNSTANHALDRKTVSELNGMLILLDKKIVNLLKSEEFKEYIDFANVRQATEEVAKITNIKYGLPKQ
jgi:hypothetical protein